MCRQRFESDKSKQHRNHGEEVRYDDGDIVCIECECTHDIDQHQTLADYRKPDNADNTPAEPPIADGGEKVDLITKNDRQEAYSQQWKDANSAAQVGEGEPVVSEEQRERANVYRRIEMVKDAHPNKSAVELAAKYEAFEHIDVVRLALDEEVQIDVPDFDNNLSFGQEREPERKDPDWQVNKVRIRDKEHPASSGNGMEYVETTDYVKRFSSIIDNEHWYRCDCGVKMYGHKMAKHLGHYHGLETLKRARVSVEREGNSEKSKLGQNAGCVNNDEKNIDERIRYLQRDTGFKKNICHAIALRECGRAEKYIARAIDSTKGTVSNWLEEVEDEYGLEAVMPKMPDERGSISGDESKQITIAD
jgi:hypothetical protein